jgi:hypothetical protein
LIYFVSEFGNKQRFLHDSNEKHQNKGKEIA